MASLPATPAPTGFAAKKTTTRGIDLEISGEVLPGWNIDASYSHSRVEDSDGERIKSIVPLDIFKLWTTYRMQLAEQHPLHLGNLDAAIGLDLQAG